MPNVVVGMDPQTLIDTVQFYVAKRKEELETFLKDVERDLDAAYSRINEVQKQMEKLQKERKDLEGMKNWGKSTIDSLSRVSSGIVWVDPDNA